MADEEQRRLYSDVDNAPDPQALVEHMDRVRNMDPFREVKQRNFDSLQIQPGDQVLDVGCGPGDDARELARMVGPNGRVVGVDSSEAMISQARERSKGLDLPVEFHVRDASQLDFADDTFDAARADRVLQHVPDAGQVLREMVRVTRPGGRIAISDTDWGMAAFDLSDRELTRKLFAFGFDRGISNPWIGRQLRRLFREAGLRDIEVASHAIVMPPNSAPAGVIPRMLNAALEEGIVSEDELAPWKQEFEERTADGTLFGALVMFTVAGRKP